MRVAVAHSEDIDSVDAVEEIIGAARASLEGTVPAAGLLFAGIDHDHRLVLERLAGTFPSLTLIGCTTDGEMSSLCSFTEDGLTLVLLAPESDDLEIGAAVARGVAADPRKTARAAVEAARSGMSHAPSLCLSLPGGLHFEGALVLEGLQEALGPDVPIVGGVAADQWRYDTTYQFCNGEVHSDAIPVLLLGGPLLLSHGVASGWTPMGIRGKVTESKGTSVLTIDGAPAIAFYRKYLGHMIMPSAEYPLAVNLPGQSDFVLRSAVASDGDDGSVLFAAPVPVGSDVQVAQATRDDIVAAACEATSRALDDYPGETPDVCMLVSCASRKQILGTRTREESDSLRGRVPDGVPWAGFYGYGELSPSRRSASSEYHTATFVCLLLGEH